MSGQRKAQPSNQRDASRTRRRDPSVRLQPTFQEAFQEAFQEGFRERFAVRLHMTLLLSGVFISGLLFSKVLLELGMHSMLARYLIAVCASYAVFFLLIKIWLSHVIRLPKKKPSSSDVDILDTGTLDTGTLDAVDLGQVAGDAIEGGAPAVHKVGDFGGGGATMSGVINQSLQVRRGHLRRPLGQVITEARAEEALMWEMKPSC